MRVILLPIFLLLLSASGFSQSDMQYVVVEISGKVTELNLADSSEKPVDGISVEIYGNGKLLTTLETKNRGKYKCTLPYHQTYRVKYVHRAFVPKMVEVNAKEFEKENKLRGFAMNIDISLFRNENYMGLDFLSEVPVARASYKKREKMVVWDDAHTREINGRIRSVLHAYGK